MALRWSTLLTFLLLFIWNARCVPLNPPVPKPPTSETSASASNSPHVALLHMQDGAWFFQRLGNLTLGNKRRYAKRWNYEVVSVTPQGTKGVRKEDGTEDKEFDIDHRRAPTFGKIKLARAACSGRPNWWLLWSDADAMVVNQSVPLESIIDDGYDLIFAYDWLMLNAGMLLIKCTTWTDNFLLNVYNARKFDTARALDQSSLQSHLDELKKNKNKEFLDHVKVIPKYAMNVYLEEYRPGDFLMHMAGKLYEATEPGLWAIARQFDSLSRMEDINDIKAFFDTRFLLNYYSGTCDRRTGGNECLTTDPRRMRLNYTLGSMSRPKRYKHVALRYYFFPKGWRDPYDIPGWNVKKKQLPIPVDLHKSEVQILKEELAELERRKRAPNVPHLDKQNMLLSGHDLNEHPANGESKRPPEFDFDAPDDHEGSPLDNLKQTNGTEDEPVPLDSVKQALAHDDKNDSDDDNDSEEVELGKDGYAPWVRVLAGALGLSGFVGVVLLYRKRKRAIKVQ